MTKVLKSLAIALSVATLSTVATASPCAIGDNIFNAVSLGGVGTTTNSGFTCTGGPGDDYTFSNFSITVNATPLPSLFSMNLSGGTNAPLALLDFGFTLVAAPGDIRFVYSITSASGVLPSGIVLKGASNVQETVCTVGIGVGGVCLGSPLGSGGISSGGTTTINLNYAGFNGNTIWVNKDVSGGSEFSQQLIPEPMTLSLMGVGLLGLGLFGRRRK